MNAPDRMTEKMRQAFFDAEDRYVEYREEEKKRGRGWESRPDYVYKAVLAVAPMDTNPAITSEVVKAAEEAAKWLLGNSVDDTGHESWRKDARALYDRLRSALDKVK